MKTIEQKIAAIRGCLRTMLLLPLLLVASISAQAEPYRVGAIIFNQVFSDAVDGLKQGLQQAGLTEGKDVIYDVRDLGRDMVKVEGIYRDFVESKTDVIFVTTTPVALAMQKLTKASQIPVIFSMVASPLESGLVSDLQKPGGNMSGINHLAFESLPKRLQLFHKAFPHMRKVAAFYNPREKFLQGYLQRYIQPVAKELQLEIVPILVESRESMQQSGQKLAEMGVDGIFMQPDPQSTAMFDLLIAMSRQHKLPFMVVDNSMLGKAGVMGYSPNFRSVGVQAGAMAAKVLQGGSIGDQPVQNPDRVELVVSVREAKLLELRPSREILVDADKIIR